MPLRLIEGQYAPGDPFCVDLATDDVAGAAEFYGRLFGWEFEGEGGHLRAMKNGRMAAGLGLMEALGLERRMWWVCLASPEPGAGAKKAESLGATVVGPTEVEGLGQIAAVEDPGGAAFALWQPKNINPGVLQGTHGGVAWAELLTKDPASVASFYEEMFGVNAVAVESNGTAGAPEGTLNLVRQELQVNRMTAGIVPLGGHGANSNGRSQHGEPTDVGRTKARWRAYFMIEDSELFTQEAESLGAKVLQSRVAASGQAVRVLQDPQGNEFAVVEGTTRTDT